MDFGLWVLVTIAVVAFCVRDLRRFRNLRKERYKAENASEGWSKVWKKLSSAIFKGDDESVTLMDGNRYNFEEWVLRGDIEAPSKEWALRYLNSSKSVEPHFLPRQHVNWALYLSGQDLIPYGGGGNAVMCSYYLYKECLVLAKVEGWLPEEVK